MNTQCWVALYLDALCRQRELLRCSGRGLDRLPAAAGGLLFRDVRATMQTR